MQQQALSYPLQILQIGRMEYFQIPLPRDLERIIGVECGMVPDYDLMDSADTSQSLQFRMRPNKYFGKLSLQTPGPGGLFYQEYLLKDRNLNFFEHVGYQGKWQPTNWTHGRKQFEVPVQVQRVSFLEGFYTNLLVDDAPYTLHIYIWMQMQTV